MLRAYGGYWAPTFTLVLPHFPVSRVWWKHHPSGRKREGTVEGPVTKEWAPDTRLLPAALSSCSRSLVPKMGSSCGRREGTKSTEFCTPHPSKLVRVTAITSRLLQVSNNELMVLDRPLEGDYVLPWHRMMLAYSGCRRYRWLSRMLRNYCHQH